MTNLPTATLPTRKSLSVKKSLGLATSSLLNTVVSVIPNVEATIVNSSAVTADLSGLIMNNVKKLRLEDAIDSIKELLAEGDMTEEAGKT